MLIQRRLRVLQKLKFLKKKEEKALKSSSRAYLILTKNLSSPISFKKCILKKQCLLTFFTFSIKRRFLKVILELKSLNVQKFQLKNGNLLKMKKSNLSSLLLSRIKSVILWKWSNLRNRVSSSIKME